MTDRVRGAAVRPFEARTGSTVLRPVRDADAAALFPQIHGRHGVLRWLCWGGPATVDDLRERYRTWSYGTDEGPAYMFAVEGDGGAVIGEGSLRFDEHPGVGEIGYWLGEEHHGRGHGRDVVELLTRVGFDLCGAFALIARVKEGNDASIHVLKRTGYVQERAPRPAFERRRRDPDDPPIAWIFSTTRRADERRTGRAAVRIDPG